MPGGEATSTPGSRPLRDARRGRRCRLRNPASATNGWIGVPPEHRGRGDAGDLLAEALPLFTEAGEGEVNDATDLTNTPMLDILTRAGYRIVGHRVIVR